MFNHQEIEIQNIDHLGIIAGIIDAIGLVDIINELVGQEAQEKISPGHVSNSHYENNYCYHVMLCKNSS